MSNRMRDHPTSNRMRELRRSDRSKITGARGYGSLRTHGPIFRGRSIVGRASSPHERSHMPGSLFNAMANACIVPLYDFAPVKIEQELTPPPSIQRMQSRRVTIRDHRIIATYAHSVGLTPIAFAPTTKRRPRSPPLPVRV